MKTKNHRAGRRAGTTFPEVLIASVVASIVLGGLMVGSVVLQRSFSASDQLSRAQADLLRVADYISRDIRNATTVNTTVTAPVFLTVTTGDYYDRRGTPANARDDIPNDPVLGRDSVTYGSNPLTIRYLKSGSAVLREVTRFDAGVSSASTTRIADNVDNLSLALDAEGTATITSSTATRYARRKAGAPSPVITIVMVAKPRNPTP